MYLLSLSDVLPLQCDRFFSLIKSLNKLFWTSSWCDASSQPITVAFKLRNSSHWTLEFLYYFFLWSWERLVSKLLMSLDLCRLKHVLLKQWTQVSQSTQGQFEQCHRAAAAYFCWNPQIQTGSSCGQAFIHVCGVILQIAMIHVSVSHHKNSHLCDLYFPGSSCCRD